MSEPLSSLSHPQESTIGRFSKSKKRSLPTRLWLAAQRAWPNPLAALLARLILRPQRQKPRPSQLAVLQQAQRVRLPTADGELAVYRWGDGPAVLLLHGWSGSAAQMTPLVAPLLAAGLSVLTLDMPGHGRARGRLASIWHYCRAIEAVAQQHGALHGPLHGVVAHSFGALAILLAQSRGLALPRLAAIAPLVSFDHVWQQLAKRLALQPATLQVLPRPIEKLAGGSLAALEAGELAAKLQALPAVQIWHDVADREVPFSHAEMLAAALPGSLLQPQQGMGHARILQDKTVAQAVARFLADGATHDMPLPPPAPLY